MTATRLHQVARLIGISLVALVYFLPMIVGGKSGVMANTAGLVFVMVTVPVCWALITLPMCASLAWHRTSGRLALGYVWVLIGIFAPAVATLPGMAVLHISWGIFHHHPRALENFAMTTVNVLLFANLAIRYHAAGGADSERRARSCLYASLAIASVTNMLFPFVPLD